ncbi:hypothetical protein HK099_001445 [Clydaea vesicula]|uniref:Uncharacterized protein n=1 Tax=Clydaea vesicula TaxID=447962 RepID=A0AAD5U3H5_9FUNG|nr:hypothetical protein HK099_001445 [Clydaea vesicula]
MPSINNYLVLDIMSKENNIYKPFWTPDYKTLSKNFMKPLETSQLPLIETQTQFSNFLSLKEVTPSEIITLPTHSNNRKKF